jgi:hypothetical protein
MCQYTIYFFSILTKNTMYFNKSINCDCWENDPNFKEERHLAIHTIFRFVTVSYLCSKMFPGFNCVFSKVKNCIWYCFDNYFTYVVLVLLYILLKWQPEPLSRNESGRFGALKSDSTRHFFRNACITVFTVFWLLTDFVCLYNYEFWLSLCKIVRSSVILLLLLFSKNENVRRFWNNIPRLKIKILESQNIL